MGRYSLGVFSLFLLAAAAAAGSGSADTVPGQKPLIIIDGSFRYLKGSWASYHVTDLAKNETYRMYISVLDQTTRKKKGKKTTYRWMEIQVEAPGQPAVVTRILAQETREGPGELESVIVQVAGMDAFTVPRSFFDGQKRAGEPAVTQIQTVKQVRRLERKQYSHGGRKFEAWTLEAVDSSGKPVRAVVSEELAPIGVYLAESGDLRMELTDWGMGAKTRINGPAYPFWLWLMGEVSKGAAGTGNKQ